MIGGAAYILFSMLASPVGAEDVYGMNGVLDASLLRDNADVLVRVGLLYGDDVEVEFQIRTGNGFTVGIEDLEGDKSFTEIWELDENVISCLSDANIAKENGIYSIAKGYNDTYIGGYHVQIDCDDLDREEFETFFSLAEYLLSGYGLNVIPAYIYTGYAVRIGDFATWEDAARYLEPVMSLFDDRVVSVVAPTRNAVAVMDSYTEKLLFEYDCGLNSVIGFRAHEDENGNAYMMTPAGNEYDGVFAFKRFVDNRNDGVSLINVLPLEAYIAGVLPFEISNSWPIEVQKEFAITVRSFTLTHLGTQKHAFYGFDLCNTTCCEVYKGAGRINDAVMEAVGGTLGKVICYNGDIVTSYYSSTVGGVTVSAADCWGGSEVPYLQPIETPWEDYMNHANGFWTCEVSPAELLERLHKAGYNELTGSIADIQIEELAHNSTYVKKLGVTDTSGNHITITYTDKVRTSLTPYVNSANFVVGRGSVEYTEATVAPNSGSGSGGTTPGAPVPQKDKSEGLVDSDEIYVLTSSSYDRISYDGELSILTADGEVGCTRKTVFAATKETAEAYIGSEYGSIADYAENSDNFVPSETEDTNGDVVYKTAYANDPNNFIFVGKGWGHGVGMSQWGCYDLAVQGKKYDEIIKAYFPMITIVDYHTTNNYRYMTSE